MTKIYVFGGDYQIIEPPFVYLDFCIVNTCKDSYPLFFYDIREARQVYKEFEHISHIFEYDLATLLMKIFQKSKKGFYLPRPERLNHFFPPWKVRFNIDQALEQATEQEV